MISPETYKNFYEYIDSIHKSSKDLTIKKSLTDEESILQNLSCLVEEVGETSAEIRKFTKMSFSQKKVDNFKKSDLEEEIVDVLITTFLLSKSVGIENLDEAIKKKIEKNNKRGY